MKLKKKANSKSISLRKGRHYNHFTFWFDAIREGTSLIEDATFGYRAATPALLCNESSLTKKVIQWDPFIMDCV